MEKSAIKLRTRGVKKEEIQGEESRKLKGKTGRREKVKGGGGRK